MYAVFMLHHNTGIILDKKFLCLNIPPGLISIKLGLMVVKQHKIKPMERIINGGKGGGRSKVDLH